MIAFYQKFLGVEPVAKSDGMAIFMVGETKLFIHRSYTPNEGELPPENHLAFLVADVDAVCEQLRSEGISNERP